MLNPARHAALLKPRMTYENFYLCSFDGRERAVVDGL